MDKTEVFVLVALFTVLLFRLYQKYVKKGKDPDSTGSKHTSGSLFSSSSKDDDYEPYSKK